MAPTSTVTITCSIAEANIVRLALIEYMENRPKHKDSLSEDHNVRLALRVANAL